MKGRRGLFGNILPPDECWLLDSRLPTVILRMNRQSKNAQRIAEKLVGHPKLVKVYYPTLFDDPEQIRIRFAQCDFPGGLFSIELKGGKAAAFDFLRHLRIGKNAVSLGGMETLVCHPKTTTHSSNTGGRTATGGNHGRAGPRVGGSGGLEGPARRLRAGPRKNYLRLSGGAFGAAGGRSLTSSPNVITDSDLNCL
jgi:O-acetylhomoserine/O-acetylserine sulfhydrylase-like pyridoxal-dependent enzyme